MSFIHKGHRHDTVDQARECEVLGQSSERFERDWASPAQLVEQHQARKPVQTVEREEFAPVATEDPAMPAPSLAELSKVGVDVRGVYVSTSGYFGDKGEAIYHKVQVSRTSGAAYAKVWDGQEWQYAGRSPLHHLSTDDEVKAEQARDFGWTYHACIFCGTELTETAEGSSLTGYGPICADKRGLPWTRNGDHAEWSE